MAGMAQQSERLEAYIAAARRRPEPWRLVAGVALAVAGWIAALLLALKFAHRTEIGVLLAYLASFAGLILGVAAAARWLQRRPVATLLGPRGFVPRHFLAGAAVAAALGAASAAVVLATSEVTRPASLAAWALRLPLALPALLAQTAAEELAFRGFLMQGLAARFRSPFVWFLLPALLFGLLHWNGESGPRNAWLTVGAATVIGLVLADVTIRTGDLSAAIGLHFANNVFAVLVLAPSVPLLSDLALWVVPLDPTSPDAAWSIAFDTGVTVAAWVAWRAIGARRSRLHSGGPGHI